MIPFAPTVALEEAWLFLKAGIHYTRDGRAIGSGPNGSVTAEDLIAANKARETAAAAREAAARAEELAGPDGFSTDGKQEYYDGPMVRGKDGKYRADYNSSGEDGRYRVDYNSSGSPLPGEE